MGAGGRMCARMQDGGARGCHNQKKRTEETTMGWRVRNAIERPMIAAGLVAIAALAIMPFGAAHAAWPERQTTLIACFPPGGGRHFAARLIAPPLSEALGQPVIVENRAGAGGNI